MARIEEGKLVVEDAPLTGAEELRLALSNINATREGFNDRFSAEELLRINRALVLSDWDIFPDEWDERQVQEALAGKPPRWNDDMEPLYE